MRTILSRTDTVDLEEWDRMIADLRGILNGFKAGCLSNEEALEFLSSHIALMANDGSWGFVKPEEVPDDVRVDYYYIPTYLSAAILLRAYLDYSCITDLIDGYRSVLQRALLASTGRSFYRHGYEEIDGVLETMQIFFDGGAANLLTDTNLCPANLLEDHLKSFEIALNDETTRDSWGDDYSVQYNTIINRYRAGGALLFVYGTLLKGRSNHCAYLTDVIYKGEARLENYALFDLWKVSSNPSKRWNERSRRGI